MSDVFHKGGYPITSGAIEFIEQVKTKAEELHVLFSKRPGCDPSSIFPDCRESAIAKTKLEEAVMWFVKGICKEEVKEYQ